MSRAPNNNEFMVICAVCQRPTPVGRTFCQHCWSVLRGNVVSARQTEEMAKQRSERLRARRRVRLLTISLVALVVVLLITCVSLYYGTDFLVKPPAWLDSDSSTGEWAMFRHGLGRSGCSDSIGILPRGNLKWVFQSGASIYSSPSIAGNIVYFGSRDHRLYAVDAATGAKCWEYVTGSWVESSPAVVDGVVYFGSNDGKLHAVDAETGRKLWEFAVGYPVRSSPAVAGEAVYFGADDYSVYAVHAVKGVKLWQFVTDGYVASSPVVAEGIVYVGSNDGFCYALDGLSGRLRLRFKAYSPVPASPAVSHGVVYCCNFSGRLFAFDGKARSSPWEHELRPYWLQAYAFGLPVPKPSPQSGFLWEIKIASRVESSPLVTDDTLYIGATNKLVAIDLVTHQKRWEFVPDGVIAGCIAKCGDNIYLGTGRGSLYAINAGTGEMLWKFHIGSAITSSPSVSQGVIYVGSDDGALYAVE